MKHRSLLGPRFFRILEGRGRRKLAAPRRRTMQRRAAVSWRRDLPVSRGFCARGGPGSSLTLRIEADLAEKGVGMVNGLLPDGMSLRIGGERGWKGAYPSAG